jgi:hypothetical protein
VCGALVDSEVDLSALADTLTRKYVCMLQSWIPIKIWIVSKSNSFRSYSITYAYAHIKTSMISMLAA